MCYKMEIAEVENKQKRGWGNKWPLIIITTNEDHWIGVEVLGIWQIQPVYFQLDWLVWYKTFQHVNTYPHKNLQTSWLASVSQYFSPSCPAKKEYKSARMLTFTILVPYYTGVKTGGAQLEKHTKFHSKSAVVDSIKASWSQYGIAWTTYTDKQTKGFLFYVACSKSSYIKCDSQQFRLLPNNVLANLLWWCLEWIIHDNFHTISTHNTQVWYLTIFTCLQPLTTSSSTLYIPQLCTYSLQKLRPEYLVQLNIA